MKIWIHINGNQEGPFDIDELPMDRMDANTPVWYEGLSDWMPAGNAPVTAVRFRVDDNAQNFDTNGEGRVIETVKSPPTYMGWSLLLTICCCNPVGLVSLLMGAYVSSKMQDHDYEGAKRASIRTEWWLMITIVTGLIMLPFVALIYS